MLRKAEDRERIAKSNRHQIIKKSLKIKRQIHVNLYNFITDPLELNFNRFLFC